MIADTFSLDSDIVFTLLFEDGFVADGEPEAESVDSGKVCSPTEVDSIQEGILILMLR